VKPDDFETARNHKFQIGRSERKDESKTILNPGEPLHGQKMAAALTTRPDVAHQ
jgi:hypothetical protein